MSFPLLGLIPTPITFAQNQKLPTITLCLTTNQHINMKSNLLRFAVALFSALAISVGIASAQQNVTVTGTVVDDKGEPVIGAALQVKGTLQGTVTDEYGAYSLETRSNAVLEVSSIGYATQEVAVNGRTKIDITLAEDTTELEETVVIAYGEARARDFTGAVQQINVSNSPQSMMGFTNPTEILRGNVPGMQVTPPSGVGQAGSMLVRGRRSLGASSNEPLLVVDGMIYKGSMTNIDPNNIESIQVLKDASSLAAYGSQAAQGVIMITTKKGMVGKPNIEFSTTQSFNTPTYKRDWMDAREYVHLRNARAANYSNLEDTSFMSEIEKKNWNGGNNPNSTNWFDISTHVGHTQNYNARVSGGSETFNYSFSFGRSIQNGIQIGNTFNRTSINTRINAKINKYIEAGLTMDYSGTSSKGASSNPTMERASPLGSPYFDNTGKMRKFPSGDDTTTTNPLWGTGEGDGLEREMQSDRTTYNGFLTVKAPWIEGLSYKFNVSYGKNKSENLQFYHEAYYPSMPSGQNEDGYTEVDLASANGSVNYGNSVNWVIDNIITYQHTFGRKHSLNSSLVYTRDSDLAKGFSMAGSNFADFGNTLLGWYGLNQAGTRTVNAGTYTLHNDIGYLARAMYSYDSRYSVNLSFRRDGSSVFGANRKWGNFPAVGLAWTVTNEKFMKNNKTFDDLKLKASWGINGSQTLAPYGTLSRVTLGRAGYGIATSDGLLYSQYVSAIGNPDLGWQKSESLNIGAEFSVLKRRISGEINGYISKTTDQIFSRTIPIMGAGVSSQQATMGQINNWGIEANINTLNIQKKDFSWSSNITFNLNRNKLKKLWGGENEADDLANGFFINRSLDTIWWYDQDGVVQENGTGSLPTRLAGEGNTIDQDGNGVLDNNDKIHLGNSRENFRVTWGNTFSYKNLQLYFLINWTAGGHGYALADNTFAYKTNEGFNYCSYMDIPYWTPDNKSDKYVAATFRDQDETWRVYSSYANVRLQNLNLSYNLGKLVKNWGINGARIYVSGSNLFYIAPKWKCSDPEGRGRGGMMMRTYTVGLSISL